MIKVIPGEKQRSDDAMLREFTHHIRKSGVQQESRARRSFTKKLSKGMRRNDAQRRTTARKERDYLIKIGRIQPRF